MKELLTVTLVIIGLSLNLVPFLIALNALFPARIAKTQQIANQTPGRAFAIGMVNFLFFLVIALVIFSLAEKTDGLLKVSLTIPAILVAAILSIALSFGLGGMANLAGGRVAPGQSTWKQTLWGVLLLGLGGSFPLFGWFLLLPYIAWVGLGAFIIGLFKKTAN
jgi:hypothetical protein